MPLATNMCVVAFDQLAPAVEQRVGRRGALRPPLLGRPAAVTLLAGICENFGLGLSMHSNSHLGISLAAMIHLAAATPHLTYACDTHWPWKTEEVVEPGALAFSDGAVQVPTGPASASRWTGTSLAGLHEQYLACGIRDRDDTGYMRSIDPGYRAVSPRW